MSERAHSSSFLACSNIWYLDCIETLKFHRYNSAAEKLTSSGNGKFPLFPGYFLKQGLGFMFTTTCFRVTRWPECLSKTPRGLGKFVLAFMVVLLQVKVFWFTFHNLIYCQPTVKNGCNRPLDLFKWRMKYRYLLCRHILWLTLREVGRLKQISVFWTDGTLEC